MSQFSPRPRMRLQWVAALLMALCLLVMAVLVGSLTQVRLRALAHETASDLFTQVARRNAQKLQDLMSNAGSGVQFLASLPLTGIDGAGRIDRPRVMAMLLATVQAQPQLQSAYIGFDNDEFLEVLGVRADPGLIAVLRAPEGSHFALRTIERKPAVTGIPMESWVFLDARGVRLGLRADAPPALAPSQRPWYRLARDSAGLQLTPAYEMAGLPESGVSLAQKLSEGQGVVGVDLVFSAFDAFAHSSMAGHEGGVIVTDEKGALLSRYADAAYAQPPLTRLENLAGSANAFAAAAAALAQQEGSSIQAVQGQEMVYARSAVAATPSTRLWVTAFSPVAPFAAPLRAVQRELLWLALGALLLILPLAYLLSRWLGRMLGALVQQAQRIQHGDLSGDAMPESPIEELQALCEAQHTMKLGLRERSLALQEAMRQLSCLVDSGRQLSERRTSAEVAQQCVASACTLVGASSAQLWRREGSDQLRLVAESHHADLPATAWAQAPSIACADGGVPSDPCATVFLRREPLVHRRGQGPALDLGAQARVAQWLQMQGATAVPERALDALIAVPLMAGGAQADGVLVLLNPREPHAGSAGMQDAIDGAQTLAAQAGIALENLALAQSQEDFMTALIKLIAGAVDAKSDYTGGHCARVPELARMLAEAASATASGPLEDFHFSTAQQWREFHIGTWLHDCGKVTTPEFVMDKATKLEVVYNRIHEVRMRFEVLRRDAELACLKAVIAGEDSDAALRRCAARWAELEADFAFVAECNIGGETMAPERIERLERIAQQTWWRHFDDRLGLSHGERQHLQDFAAQPLPAREMLLADKPEHVVPRPPPDPQQHRYRFAMDVPQALYDRGELHNLRVLRGTLTAEDRFKINEHVIQTIVMLEQLPLPDDLKRISEYAGTHHETLIGTGYPRRLDAAQLSVPARIMAVADIFEALTASDRPYKPAKKLSESVRILYYAKRDGHIDGDVFDLLLSSGVYLDYARRYMRPELIDAVEISEYLG